MRILVLLSSVIVGVLIAVVSQFVSQNDTQGKISSTRGTTWLQELRDIGELRVMRAEVCTVQQVKREGQPKGPWGVLGKDFREVDVVVPVQIELGINLKDISYHKRDDGTYVFRVPRIRMVRTTSIFEPDNFVIWKDEGKGFQNDELVKDAAKQGEKEAEIKLAQLKMDHIAQQQADETVREIVSALLSVSKDKIEIERLQR